MGNFFTPVNLHGNEVREIRLESLTNAPAHAAGRIYFNSADGRAYISDGAAWLPFGGIAPGSVGTNGLADGAVTTPKIGASQVTLDKLADDSVNAAKIVNGTITDAEISASAAIAKSKLAALNIVNADISASAAIAKSKLAALNIVNADVSASAAIARSKLDFGTGLTNADIASNAQILLSKLAVDPLARTNHTGTQTAATISDFTTAARAAMNKATIDALDVDADTIDGLDSAALEKVANKNQPNGYAGLDGSGKIPDGLLPALAITDTHVVTSQAAMLALTAQVGDVAIRTDEDRTYILRATPASTLANWEMLRAPQGGGGTVTSVGATGPLASTGGVNPVISIVPNGITGDEIANNAIGSGELANGAVTTAKIGDGQVTNDKLASGIDVAKVTGAVQKRTFTIGDGSATSFVLNHGLGTDLVSVQVSESAGNKEVVHPTIRRTDANNVTVIFSGHTPANGEFTVVVV